MAESIWRCGDWVGCACWATAISEAVESMSSLLSIINRAGARLGRDGWSGVVDILDVLDLVRPFLTGGMVSV